MPASTQKKAIFCGDITIQAFKTVRRMLIQFKVKNFRSIRNELTFNTVARDLDSPESSRIRHHTPQAPATQALNLASFVYGPNASGKSNLIRAIGTMKAIIMNSSRTSIGDTLPFEPYKLSELTKNDETEFEIELIANNVRYQYGFVYNEERILEEWLFAYPKGKPQKWLSRYFDEEAQAYSYDRCDNLSGHKKVWEAATRDNALFLSTAVQLKSDQLEIVYNWFKDTLRVVGPSGPSNLFSIEKIMGDNPGVKKAFTRFMRAADFSISDFSIDEIDIEKGLELTSKNISGLIKAHNKKTKAIEVKSAHRNELGGIEYLDLEDESDGTQKVFELAGPWLDTFENSRVLIMDELNLHLHPNLTVFLISLFYEKELNSKGSQIIAATHEINLLKEQITKRDQIWVMDRYKDGSSALNSLKKYSPRPDLNLEKAFIQGRFEGVPVTNAAEVIRARSDYHG